MGRLDRRNITSNANIFTIILGVNNMEFEHLKWRKRKSQSFDKTKIFLEKAGKKYNVYDKIQEAREDTEIIPTLKKYGCIDRMELDHYAVYGDFRDFNDLRTLKEQQIKANNMFYNLPLETRQKFNNDINQFMKDGEKYVKQLVDIDNAKAKEQAELNKPTTTPEVM